MESLQIIEQAINLATTKGVFNLQEVDIIINALKDLKSQFPKAENEDIS